MKHSLCILYIFWILYSICCYYLVPEQIQAHTGLGKDWIGQEDRSYQGTGHILGAHREVGRRLLGVWGSVQRASVVWLRADGTRGALP